MCGREKKVEDGSQFAIRKSFCLFAVRSLAGTSELTYLCYPQPLIGCAVEFSLCGLLVGSSRSQM